MNLRGMSLNKFITLDLNEKTRFNISRRKFFYVTLMHANHCEGAVMFLFEGYVFDYRNHFFKVFIHLNTFVKRYFGKILATGDFRYTPSMFNKGSLTDIDKCYVDTTFFEKIYNNIPSKKNAFKAIKNLIENKLETCNNPIFGVNVYKIGKEDLLIKLAKHFNTKIAISKERYERYDCYLGDCCMENFTTQFDDDDTIIYVFKDFPNMRRRNRFKVDTRALVINDEDSNEHLYRSLNSLVQNYISDRSIRLFKIPYSEHSSYRELIEFIRLLRPAEIIPNDREKRDMDLSRFDQYLTSFD